MGKSIKTWIKTVSIRALRTMAQVAISKIAVDAAGLFDVDWRSLASVTALSGVVCVLMAIGERKKPREG